MRAVIASSQRPPDLNTPVQSTIRACDSSRTITRNSINYDRITNCRVQSQYDSVSAFDRSIIYLRIMPIPICRFLVTCRIIRFPRDYFQFLRSLHSVFRIRDSLSLLPSEPQENHRAAWCICKIKVLSLLKFAAHVICNQIA